MTPRTLCWHVQLLLLYSTCLARQDLYKSAIVKRSYIEHSTGFKYTTVFVKNAKVYSYT